MGDWLQGAQGATGGAMTGAALGSAFTPVGTVVGAIGGGLLGALGGWLGGDGGKGDQQKRLDEMWRNGQHTAPQAANSPYERNRAALISQLEAMASGRGPSLAANQMREAMDRSTGAQTSLAAGAAGRGVNPGAAYMNASNQTSAIQSQGARDTANARVQEQYNAQNLLSGTLQGAIGQNNQLAMSNVDAQLRAMGLNDAQRQYLLAQYAGQVTPGMGTSLLAGGLQAGADWAGQRRADNAAKGKGGTTGGYIPNSSGGRMDPNAGQAYSPPPVPAFNPDQLPQWSPVGQQQPSGGQQQQGSPYAPYQYPPNPAGGWF